MSTVPTAADAAEERSTGTRRARIDATETSVREVRSFVARNDCEVHFERRGGRTALVVER